MKNKETESVYLVWSKDCNSIYATKKTAFKRAEVGSFISVAIRFGEMYKFSDFVWYKKSETEFEVKRK